MPVPTKPITLYPTMASLKDAVDYAKSRLPITTENELMAILSIYHNTLLAQGNI